MASLVNPLRILIVCDVSSESVVSMQTLLQNQPGFQVDILQLDVPRYSKFFFSLDAKASDVVLMMASSANALPYTLANRCIGQRYVLQFGSSTLQFDGIDRVDTTDELVQLLNRIATVSRRSGTSLHKPLVIPEASTEPLSARGEGDGDRQATSRTYHDSPDPFEMAFGTKPNQNLGPLLSDQEKVWDLEEMVHTLNEHGVRLTSKRDCIIC